MVGGILLWLAFAIKPDAALQSRVHNIARSIDGRVGVAMRVIETGESASIRGNDRFPMESVCKLPIAMAILTDVDHGDLTLEETIRVLPADLVPPAMHSPLRDKSPNGAKMTVRELLEFTIQQSDGTASDVLLRLAGGPARITDYARKMGASGIVVRETEKAIGLSDAAGYRNWATPAASVSLLASLYAGEVLSSASRDLLLKWMATSATSTHRIQGMLPPGTIVAHKTGTSGTAHRITRGTNDIGLVTLPNGRHLAIAVYIADSGASEAAREGVIAQISKAAWERWAAQ
jgi:beta-lactamase class A